MFEKLKANILFYQLLKRPDISKAYKMVDEKDSWFDTISRVHKSLEEIQTLPHRTLEITSRDGLSLKGIYYPARNTSRATVICIHGYTSHAEREWAFPGLFYLSLGYNVLIPYQRAHGISEGKYISFGALEQEDMMLWAEKIGEITPDGSIVFHGLSMGGGIALFLSDKAMKGVKAIISDAPSISIENTFKNIANGVFKGEGGRIAELVMEKFKREFKRDARDYDGLSIVRNSKYPLLLSAGENENLSELLLSIKEASPEETEIIILPGCNHGNGMYKQTEMYQGAIKSFLDKAINN